MGLATHYKLTHTKDLIMNYYNERLHNMLRVKRPHDSAAEKSWAHKYILSYPGAHILGPEDDPAAYVIEVHQTGTHPSRTMFSCHIDTVHREGGRQTIKYNKAKHVYYKDDGKPLGADDTAGCWLLLEMIDAGVPGTYVFHRGEECGGIGSSYIAEQHKEFLKRFDRAIAFDRKGSTSVITHQGWGRCASDEFAEALSDALNSDGISMYAPDDTGIFTDTANYVDHIPECTNVSCGYASEHTGSETLHLPTLFALRNQCIVIDWESLPTTRDPRKIELTRYKDYTWDTWHKKDKGHHSMPDLLVNMSKAEMLDMAYTDPETFVALVREELFGEDLYDDEANYYYENIGDWA
jgi:hypothetical protein